MKKIIVYIFAALFTVPTLVNVAYGEPTGSDSSNTEREQKEPLLRMETRGLSQVSTTQNDTEIAIREIGISCSATDIAATNKILEEKGHPLLNTETAKYKKVKNDYGMKCKNSFCLCSAAECSDENTLEISDGKLGTDERLSYCKKRENSDENNQTLEDKLLSDKKKECEKDTKMEWIDDTCVEKLETLLNNAEDTTTNEESTDDDKNIEGKEKLYNALSGASTAMVGIGAMQAAQALSEKKSDAAAETDMTAYLATMRCDYGRGNTYKLGEEEIDVGGGNELINYVTEYKTLASRLQKTKTALKMTPGIESEKILDKAESNLYTYAPSQKVQSTFGSLANALRDENSEDAQKWAEQKKQTQTRLVVGASVAAAGLVTAVTTNLTLGKKLRDAKRAEQDNTGIGDAKIFDNND